MPAWLPHATDEQKARFRAAISEGQKRSWKKGRKGNYRRPRGREDALYAQASRKAARGFIGSLA